jgi:sec-independent protein translocase protein TatC
MTKYFLELKARISLIVLAWFSSVIIGYFYKDTILFLVLQPDIIKISDNPYYFIFTNITEVFSVYIQIILWFSVQVMFFQTIYHVFTFLSFALFRLEYYFLKNFLKISFIIFAVSLLTFNYLLIPLTWEFFLSFQQITSNNFISLHFEAKLNEYLNFYVSLYYNCIVYFQLFTIFMFFFSYLNSTLGLIKSFRKLYYYFFVIFSTIISPPDVVSQIIISLLLIVIYEFLVFIFAFKSLLVGQPVKTY